MEPLSSSTGDTSDKSTCPLCRSHQTREGQICSTCLSKNLKVALDHFRASMQRSFQRLEDAEQQLDTAATRLKTDMQTVGLEAEQMQRASKQMFDELVGMLMRGRKELMQSVTEQRQRRVNELAGKHTSVTQKLNQVREAKRQCQQLLQRRLDLDLLLRKERIEAALTRAADLPEGDWSARPSRIPRISGEALIRDLMALMRKHTEIVVFRANQLDNHGNGSSQVQSDTPSDSSAAPQTRSPTNNPVAPSSSPVAPSSSPVAPARTPPQTDSATQTELEGAEKVQSEQADSQVASENENENGETGDGGEGASESGKEAEEPVKRIRTRSSAQREDGAKSEGQWSSCEFRQSPTEAPPTSLSVSIPNQTPVDPQWAYSPLGTPNGSNSPPSTAASVPATSTSDAVIYEDGLGTDGSYDYCARCSNGGDLMCCDTCPLAYHAQCLDVESSPSDNWNCPVCETKLHIPHNRKLPEEVKPAQACPLLLDLVLWHSGSIPFRKPVTRKEAPDYHSVIQRPMDLSLIERNMASGDYSEDRQLFVNDMLLIFENCLIYNKPWTEVFALGVKMRTFFEDNMKKYAGWLIEASDGAGNGDEPSAKRSRQH